MHELTFAPATVVPLDRCFLLTAFTELELDTMVEEDASWAAAVTAVSRAVAILATS